VRNTGNVSSDPVTAVLRLPPGVSTVSAASTAAGPVGAHSLDSQPLGHHPHPTPTTTPPASPAPPPAGSIACPPGSGTVTCTSPAGLAPGGSVLLVFRLAAAEGTQNGQITATVRAGSAMAMTISVLVRVPELVDQLALRADVDQFDSWSSWLWDGSPVLEIAATNTGTSTKPVTVTVDRPGAIWHGAPGFTCTGLHDQVTCTTDQPLAPHQTAHLALRLTHLRPESDTVDVTGTLGTATQSVTVHVSRPDCPLYWCLPGPPDQAPAAPTARSSTGHDQPSTTAPRTTTNPKRPDPTKVPGPTGVPILPPVQTTMPTTEPPTATNPAPALPPAVSPSTPVTPPGTTTPACPSKPNQPGQLIPGLTCRLVPGVLGLLGPV
jgi:hypothetical protein